MAATVGKAEHVDQAEGSASSPPLTGLERRRTLPSQTGALSPRIRARIDRLSVALFTICWLAALLHLLPALVRSGSELALPLAVPLAALAGYLVADFLAGAVHWLADRYFRPATPILGPLLIAPFREHHVDSSGITRHDFFEVSGNNALACVPVVLALFALPAPSDFATTFLTLFGLSLTAALVATNQFHRWAHSPDPPPLARTLQGLGLILTPERHARHHSAAHDRAYCVTSGWLNPLLDGLRVFERLEKLIDGLRRDRPRAT